MKIYKDSSPKAMSLCKAMEARGSRRVSMYDTDTGCSILVSQDPANPGDRVWHLSISHPERYPSWDEIKEARYSLLDRTKTFVMYLPPESEFVNVHPNCFHLFEEKK